MVGLVHRRAEDGLDLVADVLQHEPALVADGRLHLREVGVEVAHHLARVARFHPGGEVAQVGEEDGGLPHLAFERHAAGHDLVANLLAHVLAERLAQHLPL